MNYYIDYIFIKRGVVMNDLYDKLYEIMCKDCPSAHRCHNLCEECDEFQDELDKMEKGDSECQDKD